MEEHAAEGVSLWDQIAQAGNGLGHCAKAYDLLLKGHCVAYCGTICVESVSIVRYWYWKQVSIALTGGYSTASRRSFP